MKFKIGQVVNYTNPQGVFWGRRKIVGHEVDQFGVDRYYIEPTDTPWYAVHEDCLSEVKLAEGQGEW